MGVVTCAGCNLKFDRVSEKAEFIKGRWYHEGCAVTKNEKIALDELICKIFGLKVPGPMNNSLIKKYKDQYGYNYLGMKRALEYFYIIKKRSSSKSEERVGIIPYIYQEAQDYFEAIERRTEKIGNRAIEKQHKEILVKIETHQKINVQADKTELDKLFDEE